MVVEIVVVIEKEKKKKKKKKKKKNGRYEKKKEGECRYRGSLEGRFVDSVEFYGKGRGTQKEHKQEQTLANLSTFTRLFVINYTISSTERRRIVKMKAPPHPPIPRAKCG